MEIFVFFSATILGLYSGESCKNAIEGDDGAAVVVILGGGKNDLGEEA